MLKRIFHIFQRYADEHLEADLPGFDIKDQAGRALATIKRVSVRRNRLHLCGEGAVEAVGLTFGRDPQWMPHHSGSFDLDVPLEIGEFRVLVRAHGVVTDHQVMGFSASSLRWHRTFLWGQFLLTLVQLAPQIWRWKRAGDLGAREVVKERLRLVSVSTALPLSSDVVLPARTPPPVLERPATIIMPVYNAYEFLEEALDRVARHSGANWRLILIEDCSTDPRVRPFLRTWSAARPERVTLLQNAENLGFIRSVNRGFEAAQAWPEDPVVLLNSDALVPSGWLDRLLAPLSHPDVASVTPMSNDAEIFSAPVMCQKSALEQGQVDDVDRVAAQLDPTLSLVEAPTGVGFCMALAPQFLCQIPTFDKAFGKGYGEESDWCQKTRGLGGRHICAGNLYVEHRGGESFGSAAKQRLLERNGQLISKRYPTYDQEVQQFIAEDPLNTPRLALAVAWAGRQGSKPVTLYLAHAMGGGAEHYLTKRIEEEIATGGRAIVLRVGQGSRWRIEVHCPTGVTQGRTEDTELVVALLAQARAAKLVYSCGVGDRDAVELPEVLLRVAAALSGEDGDSQADMEVLCHDFFVVSPSYTLLGEDGQYHGVPRPNTAAGRDPIHRYRSAAGTVSELSTWQAEWRRVLLAARRIVVFSESSRAVMAEAYPEIDNRLVVEPHELVHAPPVIRARQTRMSQPTIGVLGNIGLHKGALVLEAVSQELAKSDAARLVVLGHLAPEAHLSKPSLVHGAYEWRDLPDLVDRYGITMWFMPSIWPETFSFATHEMLATELPVVAFDLGAQGEAVARAVATGAGGSLLPLDLAFLPRLATRLCALEEESHP